jgi:alkylated DNA repair dioxygenase AlkB
MTRKATQSQFSLPFDRGDEGQKPPAEPGLVDGSADRSEPVLAFALSHAQWLSWLADEWLTPDASGLLLGVGKPLHPKDVEDAAHPLLVCAWLRVSCLNAASVRVLRRGKWTTASIKKVPRLAEAVSWTRPLPLEFVARFTVASESARMQLLAMTNGFANLEAPTQSLEIEAIDFADTARVADAKVERGDGKVGPPQDWNRLRGAACMAAWAVPAIPPWLDMFCEMFAIETPSKSKANAIDAAWLRDVPWSRDSKRPASRFETLLWHSALELFHGVDPRAGWQPTEYVDTLEARLLSAKFQAPHVNRFAEETRALLEDEVGIQQMIESTADSVSLAVQLVLLRPTLDAFARWKDDCPNLPPAAWWSAAILVGLLHGFRDLDVTYRGSRVMRQSLAVRIWMLHAGAVSGRVHEEYGSLVSSRLQWQCVATHVQVMEGSSVWLDRPMARRGRWFDADFNQEDVHAKALEMVKQANPKLMRKTLVLEPGIIRYDRGELHLEKRRRELRVETPTELALGDTSRIEDRLDVSALRHWLATASISAQLLALPKPSVQTNLPHSEQIEISGALISDVPGLILFDEFIDEEEEEKLLARIDRGPWMNTLARRVQHYGWRYDYKSRAVGAKDYIGPLPLWVGPTMEQLMRTSLFDEPPDQVIVNEYLGSQGISKHVDCPECFRGPIASLSLAEAWEMVLRGPGGKKHIQLLPRRSMLVLSGPARSVWTHEIPNRQSEPWGRRDRRVSLTFRRVNAIRLAARDRKSSRL